MPDIREKIIYKLLKKVPKTADDFSSVLRNEMRGRKSGEDLSRKIDLLRVYHAMLAKGKIKKSLALEQILTKRAVRTLSGVAIVTVLTEPHECPGQCIYCPDEKEMPKSYISDEPAAARALSLQFDPYRQVSERIKTLTKNGHPTDKIELIVKGGTWNAYPPDYQYWFILRCFEAANNVKGTKKGNVEKIRKILQLAQKKNEIAKHRIIGLTLETRPDHVHPVKSGEAGSPLAKFNRVNEKNILIMRELGCTRIELGVQTIDDKILKLIKRGHDASETIRATELLKNYGFKVDYHLMPQLPGSTPAKDAKMLAEIFDNPAYRPDMIKIYPCTVVKHSPLYKWVKSGKFKPYSDKKLIELLINFKTIVPRYVRISRLIRDIPGHHIVAGNTMTNLRQVIQAEMARRGLHCNCLRCREVGHHEVESYKVHKVKSKLFVDKYEASNGTEYFLSFCAQGASASGGEDDRNVVYAFCRLRLNKDGLYPAFIRELHTYGQMLKIGAKSAKDSQHKGLGLKLIKEVEKICKKNKIQKLAVISGVGVRGYYRKLGYKLENSYMIKDLTK
ncbi:MAG: tRNA uridine(34) 5-carboxymethylaminomethyl modification radical SAM/GNAT enzyme Elp3 [Patescibacteria group bacterium]